jgi:tetratricopeptide (TPR) repeat protein
MNLGQLARTKSLGALKLVRRMETEFSRAAELNPELDYGGPDRNPGMLYLSAPGWPTSIGNHSKARQHLMRATQIAPNYPENHLDLLECYIKVDDDVMAQSEGQKVFELLPKAKEKFTGDEWASTWLDWDARWHKFEAKLAEKPHPQPPHQRK